MTLSEEFEKETGKESELQDLTYGTWGYSQDYVEWLEAKINYTRCSTQLKDKKELPFELWAVDKGYTRINELYFIKETAITSEDILLRRYNKDKIQSL